MQEAKQPLVFFYGLVIHKKFANIFPVIIVLVIMAGGAGYYLFFQKETTDAMVAPHLSSDGKNILVNDNVLLAVDSDYIFNYVTNSRLCEKYWINNIPDRKIFCTDKMFFKNQMRFISIVESPDETKIAFTIGDDEVGRDSAIGIYSRPAEQASLVTDYYLDNEFIAFSPSGANFAYQSNCFEGACNIFIIDSDTLVEKFRKIYNGFTETKEQAPQFIKWISDNEIEYKIGSELKHVSF